MMKQSSKVSVRHYLAVREWVLTHYQARLYLPLNPSYLLHLTESTYRHQANIDDEVVTMEILDTAGQVRQINPAAFVSNVFVI